MLSSFLFSYFIGPQITQITRIFFIFIICVNLCNLWTIFFLVSSRLFMLHRAFAAHHTFNSERNASTGSIFEDLKAG
jgi:hypothetical protein